MKNTANASIQSGDNNMSRLINLYRLYLRSLDEKRSPKGSDCDTDICSRGFITFFPLLVYF